MNIEESQRRFMESVEKKPDYVAWGLAIALGAVLLWLVFSWPVAEFFYRLTR